MDVLNYDLNTTFQWNIPIFQASRFYPTRGQDGAKKHEWTQISLHALPAMTDDKDTLYLLASYPLIRQACKNPASNTI